MAQRVLTKILTKALTKQKTDSAHARKVWLKCSRLEWVRVVVGWEYAWGDLPTSEVRTYTGTLKLLGSNFSEKPPVFIGGWGPNGLAGDGKGGGARVGLGWRRLLRRCNIQSQPAGSQHGAFAASSGEWGPFPGKGLGKGGKGQGKQTRSPKRRAPNLKPLSERATAATTEVKYFNCPTYNWTSRALCRSCGLALPLRRLCKRCWSWVRPRRMENLPRAVLDHYIEQICVS